MTTKKQPDPCARDKTDQSARSKQEYLDHANRLQNSAIKAYDDWLADMSPEDRAALTSLDLAAPPEDDSEVGGHSPFSVSDIADTPLARTDVDFAAEIDKPHEILADQFGISAPQAIALLEWHQEEVEAAVDREKANYLQLIVGGLLSSKNPKMNAAGLAFATNLAALNGLPCQREFARQNHVSPSAISKVVKAWQTSLDLRPSSHQKSEEACKTYSIVGKTQHWRARPLTAGAASRLLSKMRPNNPEISALN